MHSGFGLKYCCYCYWSYSGYARTWGAADNAGNSTSRAGSNTSHNNDLPQDRWAYSPKSPKPRTASRWGPLRPCTAGQPDHTTSVNYPAHRTREASRLAIYQAKDFGAAKSFTDLTTVKNRKLDPKVSTDIPSWYIAEIFSQFRKSSQRTLHRSY
jgi:hypothetical protein